MRKEKQVVKELMSIGEVPLLIGEAGIGKTAMIKDIADELKLKLVDLPVQLMNPEDLLGLPVVKEGKTEFTKPTWFPDGQAVIFLDEINRASNRIRGALLKLLYEKTVAGAPLPQGTLMAAAMNPATDDYNVDDLDDAAFLSRMIPINLGVDVNDWIEYMTAKKGSPAVIGFIKAYPEWILGGSNDPLPRPNPRTWEKISNIITGLSSTAKDNYLAAILNTTVGVKAQVAFMKFAEGFKSFDPHELFDPKTRDNLLTLKPNMQIMTLERALAMAAADPTLDFVGVLSHFVDKLTKEVFVAIYRKITETKGYDKIRVAVVTDPAISLALSKLISSI